VLGEAGADECAPAAALAHAATGSDEKYPPVLPPPFGAPMPTKDQGPGAELGAESDEVFPPPPSRSDATLPCGLGKGEELVIGAPDDGTGAMIESGGRMLKIWSDAGAGPYASNGSGTAWSMCSITGSELIERTGRSESRLSPKRSD
jgi:hypothetical protein